MADCSLLESRLPVWACLFSRRRDPAGADLRQLAKLIPHMCSLEPTEKSFTGGVKNHYLSVCLNMGGLVLAVQGEPG